MIFASPMNVILGYNQLMKEDLTDSKLLDYQKKIEQSGKLLLSIITMFLIWLALRAEKWKLMRMLKEWVIYWRNLMECSNHVAKEKNIQIKSEIA